MQTNTDKKLRDRLRRWMRQVMDENRWNSEDWARLADTSATNLTRFLKDNDAAIPSGKTLSRLAETANSLPPLIEVHSMATRFIPILSANQAARKKLDGAAPVGGRMIAVDDSVPASAIAVVVERDTMNAAGIFRGDTLVVHPDQPLSTGQVAAYLCDGKICAGIYAPPYMIPQSTKMDIHPIAQSSVVLIGPVILQVRKFS